MFRGTYTIRYCPVSVLVPIITLLIRFFPLDLSKVSLYTAIWKHWTACFANCTNHPMCVITLTNVPNNLSGSTPSWSAWFRQQGFLLQYSMLRLYCTKVPHTFMNALNDLAGSTPSWSAWFRQQNMFSLAAFHVEIVLYKGTPYLYECTQWPCRKHTFLICLV
jgi:hypothetical protein